MVFVHLPETKCKQQAKNNHLQHCAFVDHLCSIFGKRVQHRVFPVEFKIGWFHGDYFITVHHLGLVFPRVHFGL